MGWCVRCGDRCDECKMGAKGVVGGVYVGRGCSDGRNVDGLALYHRFIFI